MKLTAERTLIAVHGFEGEWDKATQMPSREWRAERSGETVYVAREQISFERLADGRLDMRGGAAER